MPHAWVPHSAESPLEAKPPSRRAAATTRPIPPMAATRLPLSIIVTEERSIRWASAPLEEHAVHFHHTEAGCGLRGTRDAAGPASRRGRRRQTVGGCRHDRAAGEGVEHHPRAQQQPPRRPTEGGDSNGEAAGGDRAVRINMRPRSGGDGQRPSRGPSLLYPTQQCQAQVLPGRQADARGLDEQCHPQGPATSPSRPSRAWPVSVWDDQQTPGLRDEQWHA